MAIVCRGEHRVINVEARLAMEAGITRSTGTSKFFLADLMPMQQRDARVERRGGHR